MDLALNNLQRLICHKTPKTHKQLVAFSSLEKILLQKTTEKEELHHTNYIT